jgi:hypothetical protein
MGSLTDLYSRWNRALIALAVLAALPAASRAGWLGFRNDLPVPVFVQGVGIVNNMVNRGKVYRLYPGEVSQEFILQTGSRQISVYDARNTRRILCQQTITCTGDQLFSLQLDSTGQVKLVTAKFPKRTPGRPTK